MDEYITQTYYGEESDKTENGDRDASFHRWLNSHCVHGWELFQVIPIKQFHSWESPWNETVKVSLYCVFKKNDSEKS